MQSVWRAFVLFFVSHVKYTDGFINNADNTKLAPLLPLSDACWNFAPNAPGIESNTSRYCSSYSEDYGRGNKVFIKACRMGVCNRECVGYAFGYKKLASGLDVMQCSYCQTGGGVCRNATVRCNKCRGDCSEGNTTVVKCRRAACCYSAHVLEDGVKDAYLVRGCLRYRSPTCQGSCKDAERVFRKTFGSARFAQCFVCKGSGCNVEVFKQPRCYKCSGCARVDGATAMVHAGRYCCYAASVFGVRGLVHTRDVAEVSLEQCAEFCGGTFKKSLSKRAKLVYCKTCSGDGCNNFVLQSTTPCYSCKNCGEVEGVKVVQCPAAACCYTALFKNVDRFVTNRGCMWKRGRKCNVCKRIANGTLVQCKKCKSRSDPVCNDHRLKPKPIQCYSCEDDTCSGNATQATCETSCCYSESFFGPTGTTNIRGCASDRNDCRTYCNANSRHDVDRITCNSCIDDLCNKDKLFKGFNCYSCNGCDKVNASTPVVICKDLGCCYKAYVNIEKYKLFYVTRGCIDWSLGIVCNTNTTCKQLDRLHSKDHPNGDIASCKTLEKGDRRKKVNQNANTEKFECLQCELYEKCGPNVSCSTKECIRGVIYGKKGYGDYRSCKVNIDCNKFRKKHSKEDIIMCNTCKSDKCNSADKHVQLKCYVCKGEDCNRLTKKNNSVICRDSGCCFLAIMKKQKFKQLSAWRGCIEWTKGQQCTYEATRKAAIERFQKDHPEGEIQNITVCPDKKKIEQLCNDAPFTTPSIECYKCSGEDCVTITPSTPRVNCTNLCCYAGASYGRGGMYNERGCANTMDCEGFCARKQFKKDYQTVECKNCTRNRCNSKKLRAKFRCYQCERCNKVDSSTLLVECRSPVCCYTAYLKEATHEPLFARRGCNDGANCNETTYKDVTFCKEKDKSKCNGDNYVPPVECYECEGDSCNNANDNTTVVICKSNWCVSASSFGKDGLWNIRKCVASKNYCDTYKMSLLKEHQNMVTCKTCKGFRCNKIELRSKFMCNQCTHCNVLPNDTKEVECISPNCCYLANVRNHPDENFYAIRGCAPWEYGMNCITTCRGVNNTHIMDHPNGEFGLCSTCEENEGDGCNNEPYIPAPMCNECFRCPQTVKDVIGVICPNQCCFTSTKYSSLNGLVHIRGCSQHHYNSSCDDFCKDYRAHQPYVQHCYSCDGYKCNRDDLPAPLFCFTCTHCNTINKNTPTTHCRHPKCCYTAHVRDGDDEGDFYTIRGCLQEPNCNLTCTVIEKQFYLAHPFGEMLDCKTCPKNATSNPNNITSNCNNKPFDPTTISNPSPEVMSCYKCRKCNRIKKNTPQTLCNDEECCYRAAVSDNPYEPLAAERGCYRLRFNQTCEHSCEHFRYRHHKAYPNGTMHVCIHCDEGDGKNCNDGLFIMPKTAIYFQPRHTTAIRCYKCTNCTEVTLITKDIHCRHPKCCYSALVNNKSDDRMYVIRNCKTKGDCDDTCRDVTNQHKSEHINGTVSSCTTCKVNDSNECNNIPYDPPKSAQDLYPGSNCYACRDCNRVTALTGSVPCKNSECCYRALLNTKRLEHVFAVRGCARMLQGQSCNNTCDYLEKNHYKAHPSGLFFVCIQCREDDTDGCNDNIFYSPNEITMDQRPPGAIMCYNCKNCSKINELTRKVECRSAKCCYVAYVKDHRHGPFYAIRGCARWKRKKPCVNTCKDLDNDHMWENPMGVFSRCLACNENDGDNCNRHPLNPPRVMPQPHHTGITCYHCVRCYTVNKYTGTVLCESPKCCYIALMKKHKNETHYIARGCRKYCTPKTTCRDVRNHHLWEYPLGVLMDCKTCNENDPDECNNQPYDRPRETTRKPPYPSIHCYTCSNCNRISFNTKRTNCPSPKCCYITLSRASPKQPITVTRGCKVTPNNCATTCETLKAHHITTHPQGNINCMTCNAGEGDECNKNNYNPPQGARRKPIKCYQCDNCNTVTPTTPTTLCQPHLCYLILAHTPTSASRNCAHKAPACEWAQQHANTTISFCKQCKPRGEDHCNNNPYTPGGASDDFNCFNCTDCTEIKMDTPKTKCDTGACFTVTLKRSTMRGCANSREGDYCEQFNPPKDAMCKVCYTDKCNIERMHMRNLN